MGPHSFKLMLGLPGLLFGAVAILLATPLAEAETIANGEVNVRTADDYSFGNTPSIVVRDLGWQSPDEPKIPTTLIIEGGLWVTSTVNVYDTSRLIFNDGTINAIVPRDDSTVDIHGGRVSDEIRYLGGTVNVYGYDLAMTLVEEFEIGSEVLWRIYEITGEFENGDPVAISVLQSFPEEEMHLNLVDLEVAPYEVAFAVMQQSLNPNSRGMVPMVVLSDADFDAATIDPETIAIFNVADLEAAPAKPERVHLADVNGDGRDDLLLHVRTDELAPAGFNGEDTLGLWLWAEADIGEVLGEAAVRVVPPANAQHGNQGRRGGPNGNR